MSEGADQIVLEYLRRVADAAYGVLRSDERLEYLARLRRSIDQTRVRQKANKPEQVRRIVERLGSPEALVERERLRLADERPEDPPRPRAASGFARPPARAASAGARNETVVTDLAGLAGAADLAGSADPRAPAGPMPKRPANETQPIPLIDPVAYASQAGPADEMEEVPEEPAAPGGAPEVASRAATEVAAAAEPVPEAGGPETAGSGSRTIRGFGRGPAASDVLAISAPGAGRPGDFLDIAARNKMASVTVILLGFGALALPVPLWLVGVVLLVLCQAWPLGDKLIGAAVPILAAAVYGLATDQAASVLAMAAYTSAGAGGPRLAFGVGGLLGAGYLGFRLIRTTRAPHRT